MQKERRIANSAATRKRSARSCLFGAKKKDGKKYLTRKSAQKGKNQGLKSQPPKLAPKKKKRKKEKNLRKSENRQGFC